MIKTNLNQHQLRNTSTKVTAFLATGVKIRVLKIFFYISYVKIRHHLHCASSPFQKDHCLNIPEYSQHDGNTTWVIACSVSCFSKKKTLEELFCEILFYQRDHNLNRFKSTLSDSASIQLLAFLTNWFLRKKNINNFFTNSWLFPFKIEWLFNFNKLNSPWPI